MAASAASFGLLVSNDSLRSSASSKPMFACRCISSVKALPPMFRSRVKHEIPLEIILIVVLVAPKLTKATVASAVDS